MKRVVDSAIILLGTAAAFASWACLAAGQQTEISYSDDEADTPGFAVSPPIVGIGNFRPVCAGFSSGSGGNGNNSSSSSSNNNSSEEEADDDDEMQSACTVSQLIIEAMEQDDLLNGKLKPQKRRCQVRFGFWASHPHYVAVPLYPFTGLWTWRGVGSSVLN